MVGLGGEHQPIEPLGFGQLAQAMLLLSAGECFGNGWQRDVLMN